MLFAPNDPHFPSAFHTDLYSHVQVSNAYISSSTGLTRIASTPTSARYSSPWIPIVRSQTSTTVNAWNLTRGGRFMSGLLTFSLLLTPPTRLSNATTKTHVSSFPANRVQGRRRRRKSSFVTSLTSPMWLVKGKWNGEWRYWQMVINFLQINALVVLLCFCREFYCILLIFHVVTSLKCNWFYVWLLQGMHHLNEFSEKLTLMCLFFFKYRQYLHHELMISCCLVLCDN